MQLLLIVFVLLSFFGMIIYCNIILSDHVEHDSDADENSSQQK